MNPWEYEQTPAPPKNSATYQADGLAERVVVPGLKALIVAIPAGLLAGLLIGAFSLAVSAWYAMPIVTLIVFLVVFWGSSQRGQWLIERLTGADLNFDGFVGQPPAALPEPQAPVRIEVIQDQGRRGDYINLPHADKLPALAAGLTSGRQFAQSVWAGNDQLFTRAEFEELRAALITGGLLKWRKEGTPAQGADLTPAGRALMRHYANHPPTTRE